MVYYSSQSRTSINWEFTFCLCDSGANTEIMECNILSTIGIKWKILNKCYQSSSAEQLIDKSI